MVAVEVGGFGDDVMIGYEGSGGGASGTSNAWTVSGDSLNPRPFNSVVAETILAAMPLSAVLSSAARVAMVVAN